MLGLPAQDSPSRTTSEPCDTFADMALHGDPPLDITRDQTDSETILRQDWSSLRHGTPCAEDVCRHAPTAGLIADDGHHLSSIREEDCELPVRQLRPQQRRKCGFQVPYLDTDETGDFDPDEYERQTRQKRRRIHTRVHYQIREDGQYVLSRSGRSATSSQKNTHDGTAAAPCVTRQLTVLKLQSDDGRTKLRYLMASAVKPVIEETKGYALRRKQPAEGIENAAELEVDLAGHPAARGCVSCFNSDEYCSLLDDESSWPCTHCEEDGNSCQLITLPRRFKACLSCKRRRMTCSYTTTRNHSGTCQQCAESAEQCVAGPMKDFLRQRARYEQAPEQPGLPTLSKKASHKSKKSPERCLECHEGSRSCFYSPDNDGVFRTGCTYCLEHDLRCTIRTKVHARLLMDHEGDNDRVQMPEPELAQPLTTDEGSTHVPPRPADQPPDPATAHPTRQIESSFTYPIVFNCDDPYAYNATPTTIAACVFCSCPEAAIYGFGLRNITIRDRPDGSECSEVPLKKQSTSLCTACTTARMNIITCGRHDMKPIIGVYGTGMSEAVFAQGGPTTVKDLEVLCSLCPIRGVYECSAEHSKTELGMGCGMRLCEYCALKLETEHDGRLQDALATLPARVRDSEALQLRADCELLRHNGALHRHLKWLGQQTASRAGTVGPKSRPSR